MAVKANRRKRKARKATTKPTTTAIPICAKCGAKCCYHLVMPIDKPRTADDVKELKWELQYDSINVFIRSHRWYRLIKGRCMYLDRSNRCKIYDRRPNRCRQMKPPECEHFGKFYQVLLTTPEQLEAHLAKRKRR